MHGEEKPLSTVTVDGAGDKKASSLPIVSFVETGGL